VLSMPSSGKGTGSSSTPKNLAMALSVEVAEVVEHFQWLTEEQSGNLSPQKSAEVREVIGGVVGLHPESYP
jgi:NTP pyrophosphatase (non-canonical NTP hydrolase)